MHLPALIRDLAVILGAATLVSLLFQRIRQPQVLGYLLAGIIIGPHTPPFALVIDLENIRTWAELGVVFLMFSLGLEFSFKKLMNVGRSALITGPLEAMSMLALGFAVGKLQHWSNTDSLFLGAILSVSSTTIIIKALEELGLKRERFAQVIFGVLVVEDLTGILILVALSTLGAKSSISGLLLLGHAIKLIGLVASWVIVGKLVIPRFVDAVGRRFNAEAVTLLSLALCLGMVILSAYFNYSVALGAFLMGAIIGESKETGRIERLMRPLRDFFGAVFFVSIGMLLDPAEIAHYWLLILGLTLLTILGKITISATGARVSGVQLPEAVRVGMGMAQIGEFSFIIAQLGVNLGVMSPKLYSIAVAVSVITTFTTPYLIRASGPVARRLA